MSRNPLLGTKLLVLLVLLAPAAGRTHAQSTLSTLTGTVADQSGAMLPGVSVTATHVGTQSTRTTTSGADGSFQIVNLDAGRYIIEAALPGFQDHRVEVELLARQTLRTTIQLAVAGTTSEIAVTAALPVIETDRATIDSSRSGMDINRLALNFRATNNTSPIVVATLAQGVQQDRSGQISVAGALPFMTSFSIDGISSQRTRGGGPSRELFPSVESIEEFKVSSANNNAEFMQVTDITTTSKSGTNDFHGGAFWFFQDSALNSVDRFAPRDSAGKAIKPDIRANSFGGSLGGPVVRNKTFFFGTFEGVRRPNESTLSLVVPPDAFRNGDLSSVTRTLTNPFTGQPYPNNQIPVNAAAAKVLSQLYPRQNQSTGTALGRPNLITNFPGDFTVNGFDARGDHNFNDRHKVFSRFTYKDVDTTGAGGSSWNTVQGQQANVTEVRQVAAAWNWILRPTLLNELRGGFSNTRERSTYPLAARGNEIMRDLGFTGLPPFPASGGIPSFEFLDGTFISSGGSKPRNVLSRTYQLSDNLTWIIGRHSFKAGVDVQRVEYEDQVTFFSGEEYGRYAFDGSYTGNAFADFLVGLPATTGYAFNSPDGSPYATHFAFFVQDSWRVTPRLSLDYGLRYDLRPPMLDRSNQLGNFDRNFPGGRVVVSDQTALSQVPASIRAAVPNTPFVTADQAGLPKSLRFTDKNNFNPRLGVAFRPTSDGKTVLRGGFGMFTVPLYGAVNYSLLGVVTSDVPLFSNRRNPDGTFAIQFPNVFPQALRAPGVNDFRRANQFDLQDPRVIQWTFTLERDLGWDTGVRLSYVGSSTKDIVWSPDLNQVSSNTLGYDVVRNTRPFRDWNVVTTRDNGAEARYDAGSVEFRRRFSGGLSFNSSYTFAKNLSDSGGAVPGDFTGENGATTLDRFRGTSDRGNLPFTRRHRSITTAYWEVPFGRGRKFGSDIPTALELLAGGVDLTGIALFQSGPFLTAFFSGGADPSGTGTTVRGFTSTQRPDKVGNPIKSDTSDDVLFDRNAYVRPASQIGRFGSAPVGDLVGPGTSTVSLTVGKNFRLTETSRIRFEASFANIFNLENLDIPGNMNITSTAFGRVTRTQSVDQAGPRTIQFSLRYAF